MDAATLNPADLLTIAGASVAAIVVTQFAKMMFTLSRLWVRIIALSTGLVVVVVAYVSLNTVTVLGVFLAVIVGMQAGMAANATFDTARKGLDYQTSSSGDQ
jgi:hypothetical protein